MIYLDHAANTSIFPEVLKEMLPWLYSDHIGNAGSIHTQGVKARKAIEKARQQVASMINADPSEIFFTSGGTESNNAWLKCFGGDLVLTTEVEHDSILEPLRNLPNLVTQFVKVHPDGSVDLDSLEYSLQHTRNTGRAVSIMWVNNELGTINPMREIGELCKKYRTFFHTDAVQAAGHIPIDVRECNIDALSMSGHKFGAPLGVGVLYIKNAVHKHPLIVGGGQENGMRGGTENVPGIVGIGRAAEYAVSMLETSKQEWAYLRELFLTELDNNMDEEFQVNGSTENIMPGIISLTIPGINSESLLLLLDLQNICISAGSACNSVSAEPSHVLRGIGMSDEEAACTVRISMGFNTGYTDMVVTAKVIAKAVHKIKAMYA